MADAAGFLSARARTPSPLGFPGGTVRSPVRGTERALVSSREKPVPRPRSSILCRPCVRSGPRCSGRNGGTIWWSISGEVGFPAEHQRRNALETARRYAWWTGLPRRPAVMPVRAVRACPDWLSVKACRSAGAMPRICRAQEPRDQLVARSMVDDAIADIGRPLRLPKLGQRGRNPVGGVRNEHSFGQAPQQGAFMLDALGPAVLAAPASRDTRNREERSRPMPASRNPLHATTSARCRSRERAHR